MRPASVLAAVALALIVAACSSTAATPTPGGGGQVVAGVGGDNGNGGNGGNGGANGGNNGNGGNGGDNGGGQPAPTESPTPGAGGGGPYVVKQTKSLGGETISGQVCDPAKPFTVAAATTKVAWTFLFVPQSVANGTVSYAYSIPGAGESHSATGTYKPSAAGKDGVRHLTLAVSDHVVFKGFDGTMPLQYAFDLVPSALAACPTPA